MSASKPSSLSGAPSPLTTGVRKKNWPSPLQDLLNPAPARRVMPHSDDNDQSGRKPPSVVWSPPRWERLRNGVYESANCNRLIHAVTAGSSLVIRKKNYRLTSQMHLVRRWGKSQQTRKKKPGTTAASAFAKAHAFVTGSAGKPVAIAWNPHKVGRSEPAYVKTREGVVCQKAGQPQKTSQLVVGSDSRRMAVVGCRGGQEPLPDAHVLADMQETCQ